MEKLSLTGVRDSGDERLSSLVFSQGGWLVSTQGSSSWVTTDQTHRWTRRTQGTQVEEDGIRSGVRRCGVGGRLQSGGSQIKRRRREEKKKFCSAARAPTSQLEGNSRRRGVRLSDVLEERKKRKDLLRRGRREERHTRTGRKGMKRKQCSFLFRDLNALEPPSLKADQAWILFSRNRQSANPIRRNHSTHLSISGPSRALVCSNSTSNLLPLPKQMLVPDSLAKAYREICKCILNQKGSSPRWFQWVKFSCEPLLTAALRAPLLQDSAYVSDSLRLQRDDRFC
jgi:hypothetical protein